ncbi:21656_t:CDS:2 [Cetraspora pellucida]|uniref:21656_t:CDS:1 n=1 Tax=Cetraspora pellucida TaxID=1433469 RepID=A0A9N9DR38_9GLOM|nr:21656_t:CDS:2 [Cetraspora pellucida]
MTTKSAKSTFGLSIQGSKQLPPSPLLTNTETNPTTAKVPDKKEKDHIAHNCTLPKNNQNQQNGYYNKNNQPKKVNYCDTTEEIYINEVWEEELYNVDQPQRGRLPKNMINNNDNQERKRKEELEELESFSSDCVPSDEESAEETKKSRKMVEIESPAICLTVMKEISTGKKVSVDEKSTIEEQLNKIIEEGNVDDKYKEEIKELFKNNRTLFANGLEELG